MNLIRSARSLFVLFVGWLLDDAHIAGPPKRRVGPWLITGILLAPFAFSWVTFRKDFRRSDCALAIVWMAFYFFMIASWVSDRNNNMVEISPDPRTFAVPEKQIALSGASQNFSNIAPLLDKAAQFDKCSVLFRALGEISSSSGDAGGYKTQLRSASIFREVAENLLMLTGVSKEEAQSYLRDSVENDSLLARDLARVSVRWDTFNAVFGSTMEHCVLILRNADGDPNVSYVLKSNGIPNRPMSYR